MEYAAYLRIVPFAAQNHAPHTLSLHTIPRNQRQAQKMPRPRVQTMVRYDRDLHLNRIFGRALFAIIVAQNTVSTSRNPTISYLSAVLVE